MSTTEGILKKVQNLIARANSTEFEAERLTCLQKADELMEKYAINEYMLQATGETKGKAIERRDFHNRWYSDSGILEDVRSRIFWLWGSCVTFCRCYSEGLAWEYTVGAGWYAPVYGTPSDLDYLNLLFTDLWLQMSLKLKPQFDSSKSLGENVYLAKEAGMKYKDIAVWVGHPEWVTSNGKGGYNVSKALLNAYKKYTKENGLGDVISMHPTTWAVSFMDGFVQMIQERFRTMRAARVEATDSTGSMALAVRDMRLQAQEALWEDFPHLNPKNRDTSKAAVRYRSAPSRNLDSTAIHRGREAGGNARIASQGESVGGRKQKEIS